MADLSFLKSDKPVAVAGLGVSGRAVCDALHASGIPFFAWDDNPDTRERLGGHYPLKPLVEHLEACAFLVPSAGMKPSHPVLQRAHALKIPIYSDVDLLLQSAPDATVIGITGTNGKSTTTALIAHVLQHAGKNCVMGGNIGYGAAGLPSLGKDGIYVLELSSYMLEISAHPVADIAVLLNITPDHLDWHGTMAHYTAAKEKIFRQRPNRPPQVQIRGQSLGGGNLDNVPPFDHPFLKGAHNRENIIATFQACRAVGLDDATILQHIMIFEGLPHRQKKIAQYNNIVFINDSKGTNPDATAKALSSFDSIFWIAGGEPTKDMLNGLETFYPKIRHAYLIGQAAEDFGRILEKDGVAFTQCGVMEKAVTQAFQDAAAYDKSATILLSPACKSWDQYKNYEERGDAFSAVVKALIAKQAS